MRFTIQSIAASAGLSVHTVRATNEHPRQNEFRGGAVLPLLTEAWGEREREHSRAALMLERGIV